MNIRVIITQVPRFFRICAGVVPKVKKIKELTPPKEGLNEDLPCEVLGLIWETVQGSGVTALMPLPTSHSA